MNTLIYNKTVRNAVIIVLFLTFGIGVYKPTQAQVAAFLISPYYGEKIIVQNYSASHKALDLSLNYEQVLAAADGTVNDVNWFNDNCHWSATDSSCGFGLYIRINHPNGYRTYYTHLSTAAYQRGTTGTTVSSGEIIGTSGATGWTTDGSGGKGPHLHFEVRSDATTYVNPFSPNLWNDGQWASPSRPIPAPVSGGEIIVDDSTDNSGGFRKGGGGYGQNQCTGNCQNWTASAIGYNNDMYSTLADRNNNSIDQWVEWTPSGLLSEGAIYEVFVYIPNNNATSWQAPLVVTYLDTNGSWTTKATTIDQNDLYDQWVSVGAYRMKPGAYVWTHDATGEANAQHCADSWCQLGVDAVKFVRRGVTYAPDVRYNSGWQSSLLIRNNGGGPATTYTRFFKNDGTNACSPSVVTLVAHQTNFVTCGSSQVASAVVEGSQDLSVVVRTLNGGLAHLDNAFVSGSTGDPAFEQTATTLYVPAIYNNIFGGINSTVHLQNAGSGQTNVTLTPRPGKSCNPCHTSFDLLLNGKLSRAASTFVGTGSSVGSLVITSENPVAVVIEES